MVNNFYLLSYDMLNKYGPEESLFIKYIIDEFKKRKKDWIEIKKHDIETWFNISPHIRKKYIKSCEYFTVKETEYTYHFIKEKEYINTKSHYEKVNKNTIRVLGIKPAIILSGLITYSNVHNIQVAENIKVFKKSLSCIKEDVNTYSISYLAKIIQSFELLNLIKVSRRNKSTNRYIINENKIDSIIEEMNNAIVEDFEIDIQLQKDIDEYCAETNDTVLMDRNHSSSKECNTSSKECSAHTKREERSSKEATPKMKANSTKSSIYSIAESNIQKHIQPHYILTPSDRKVIESHPEIVDSIQYWRSFTHRKVKLANGGYKEIDNGFLDYTQRTHTSILWTIEQKWNDFSKTF